MTPEQRLTRDVICYLEERRQNGDRIWWFKVHGHPSQQRGIPDLVIVHEGRAVFIELKAPGKNPCALQLEIMRQIRDALGVADAAWSVAEVETILKQRRR